MKPKLALGGVGTCYFHLWALKIAQEALEGAQGDPKGTKNHNLGRKLVPKIVKMYGNVCQNLKMGPQLEK